MNKTTILANGCSMCYGSELFDDYKTNLCIDNVARFSASWPGVLGENLGFERIVNLGYPSGSNDRIIRTTIDWILNNWILSSFEPNKLFVVIGWTNPMRREFYINDEWRQLIPYHDYKDVHASIFTRIYRELAWSEYESAIRFSTQIICMQQFLESYNIPYLFFDAITPCAKTNIDSNNAMDNYIPHINTRKYFNFENEMGDMASFLGTDVPDQKKRHPDIDGHRKWAALLSDYIIKENLYPLHDAVNIGTKTPIIYEGTETVEKLDKKIGLPNHPPLMRDFSRLNSISDNIQPKSENITNKMKSMLRRAFNKDPFIYE